MAMNKNRIALFAALCAMLLPFAASAALYYWQGNEGSDPLDPSNYKDGNSTVLTALPPPGSSVHTQRDGMTMKFTDASAAYLASLASVDPRVDSRIIIDVSTNITIGTKFNLWGFGYVVKRGAGNLMFAPSSLTYDNQNRCFDYRERFIVEGGDVIFPQNVASTDKSYFIGGLAISNGCTVALFAGMHGSGNYIVRLSETGLCGEGSLICTNSSSECRLYPYSSTEPFSGELFATNLALYVNGTVKLTGTNNSFKSIYHTGGILGARKFGNKTGTSSLGAYNTETLNGSNVGLLCLATEEDGPQSCYRTFRDWSATTRVVFDGGAYGGLKLGTPWNSSAMSIQIFIGSKCVKELVLTGSNTEECVFAGHIVPGTGDAEASYGGHYYLTKRGTGTWRMSEVRAGNIKRLAGIGVENGKLRFDSIAEQGTACCVGRATNLFGYAYVGLIESAPPEVDYAIRLGNVTNLEEEGAFEYSGTAAASCKTRKIAVTGNGRFGNGSAATLKWLGAKGVVPPEGGDNPSLSTLTLDGDSAPGFLTDVTEETGSAPLRIAKDGDSSWHLDGNLTFTGGIDVRKGLLTLSNSKNWTWYRLVLKQNKGSGAMDGGWETNYVYLSEFGLFDKDGKRLNEGLATGPSAAKTDTFKLVPGAAILGSGLTAKYFRLFNGDGTLETAIQLSEPISAEDETTWKYVYMHLAGCPSPVSSFDISYPNNFGGAYKYTELTHFAIEGSMDGNSWHTVTNVSDFAFANSKKWSISGGDVVPGGVVTGGAPIDTTVPAGELPDVLPNGISYLKVDAGGCFVVYGDPIEVKGIGIDTTKGMGSVSNVTFAAEGTVSIEDVPTGQMADMPCDLSACTGVENVSRWPVKIGGDPTSRFKASVTATGVKVFRVGTMVVFR